MNGAQHQRQDGDDAFEEQVEEENASGTAEQTVDDHRQLAGQRVRFRHAVACSQNTSRAHQRHNVDKLYSPQTVVN